jgi:O-antigen/teichoic acid export membrane protein
MYLCAHVIVHTLTKEQNEYSIGFVQLFALAPLFLALNANNVIDLLLSNKYKEMFYISLLVMLSTIILSFSITKWNNIVSLGWYPVIMEGACLLIYVLYIRKLKLHKA